MNSSKLENLPIIYITAFGPFEGHEVNASELVVKNLVLPDLEHALKAKINIEVLDTAYQCVDATIPTRWKSLQPKLVIHLGVSCMAKKIILENRAFNDGYKRLDVRSYCPCEEICVKDSEQELRTKIDLHKTICEEFEADHIGCEISCDPGRYLCGYVYYCSLNIDCSRTVFIHVPMLSTISDDKENALKLLTSSMESTIKAIYRQVEIYDNKTAVSE